MKKFIAAALTAALALSMSATVFAAGTTVDEKENPKDVPVTVMTEIAPTYTVSIPASTAIDFNAESTAFGAIEVTAAQIHPGKVIKVAVAAGELKNAADSKKTIPYKIMAGTGEFTSESYTAAGDKTELTLDIAKTDWNKADAGDYSATVIFTVSYEAA